MEDTKPILLLADSQLLFLKNENDEHYLKYFLGTFFSPTLTCAYIGASNGDVPEFYELFQQAMNSVGLSNCKMISSSFSPDEQEFLQNADLILLAGGDTELGLQVFREKGMDAIILSRHQQGAFLIGVSAGAIQLGWQSFKKSDDQKNIGTEALKLIPFIVLTHINEKDRAEVKTLLQDADTIKRAYEILWGGGCIYHADHTIEAVRKPINEYILKEEEFSQTLIFPSSTAGTNVP